MIRYNIFVVKIQVGATVETVRFFHCYKRGVDRIFVDHPIFLAKVSVGLLASRFKNIIKYTFGNMCARLCTAKFFT